MTSSSVRLAGQVAPTLTGTCDSCAAVLCRIGSRRNAAGRVDSGWELHMGTISGRDVQLSFRVRRDGPNGLIAPLHPWRVEIWTRRRRFRRCARLQQTATDPMAAERGGIWNGLILVSQLLIERTSRSIKGTRGPVLRQKCQGSNVVCRRMKPLFHMTAGGDHFAHAVLSVNNESTRLSAYHVCDEPGRNPASCGNACEHSKQLMPDESLLRGFSELGS
jgi:hypothetical protein